MNLITLMLVRMEVNHQCQFWAFLYCVQVSKNERERVTHTHIHTHLDPSVVTTVLIQERSSSRKLRQMAGCHRLRSVWKQRQLTLLAVWTEINIIISAENDWIIERQTHTHHDKWITHLRIVSQINCLEVLQVLHDSIVISKSTHYLRNAHQKWLCPPLEQLIPANIIR